MAPLTWRNVNGPSFSGSNDMWKVAASLMNSGIESARNGLKDFRDITKEEQSAALMAKVAAAGNDPAAIQAALAGANPAYLDPAAIKFANYQPGVFLDRAGKQLSNEGQGITNRYNSQGIDIRAYDFGRKQVEDQRMDANLAARPNALAEGQKLWADMNSQDPAIRSAALARQGDFLKTNGEALGITDAAGFNTFMTNGMRYQDQQIGLGQNRLAYAKTLDTAITSNDAKSIRDGALAMFGNNADRAIAAISNDPRIDPTTRVEALKQLNEYKAAVPGKSAADAALENSTLFPGAKPAKQSVLPGYDPSKAPPARRSNVDNALSGLVDKTEGAGRYDTLYGHAQDKGPLAGMDVSRMTIGYLKQFSSRNGVYGQQQTAKLGYLATPMGRYQIVGQTLKNTAKAMGLGDDVVFTPEVQDAMFNHIATQAISGPKTMEGKMAALRGQWEGFKNVSDRELAAAITSYQNGSPLDLNNLQRGQVTGLYSGDPVIDAQRQYQAAQAQNPAVNPTAVKAAQDQLLGGMPNQLPNQTAGQTSLNVQAPVAADKSVDASTLLAQQAANDTSVKPTVAADPAAQLIADASTQTASNNAALDAGLSQTPKTEDLSKDVKVDDQITIPGINDSRTGFDRDMRNNRQVAVNRAIEKIRMKTLGSGGSPGANALNSTWDYFFSDQKTADANAADRQKGSDANAWYQSDAAKTYFQNNPSQLKAALADPVGFANTVGKTATQRQQEARPATTTTTANRTRALNNAETVDQMFSAVNNTAALNPTNQQYQSIADAIQKKEFAGESAAETAARLTAKAGKDGTSGVLAEYKHSEVTSAIQKIRDRLGVSPAIAGALLLETGNYDRGFLGWGAGYDVRGMDKVETLWKNYQRTANAANGIASLTASDLTKYQTTQVANLQKQVTEAQATLKAAIADPNVDPAKKALYEQQLAQLPERTRALLNNIVASGAVNNNLATKPAR